MTFTFTPVKFLLTLDACHNTVSDDFLNSFFSEIIKLMNRSVQNTKLINYEFGNKFVAQSILFFFGEIFGYEMNFILFCNHQVF